jgi:anti-anti-sigma factor
VEIQSEQRQDILVISLSGSLDALTAGQAQRYIGAQLDGGQQQIVLDLDQVDFMSSSGLRLLVNMLRRSHGVGGSFRLASIRPNVRRTLEISGLERILDIYRSVEEAVGSFDLQER